jgi:hypothetical protein
MLPMTLENEEVLLYLQRALGQFLFYPPNVAGWPGGRQWIDSSTLILRLRIPRLVFDAEEFAVKPKDDDDVMGGMEDKGQQRKLRKIAGGRIIKAAIRWAEVETAFEKTGKPELADTIMNILLQTPAVSFSKNTISNYTQKDSRPNFIRGTLINIMSTPEYQLC